jgi:hypothetical protein
VAKGNDIIVSIDPRGRTEEVIVNGTPKPGTCMTIKAGVEPVGGVFTYEAFNRDANGDRALIAVLLEDRNQGKTATDAYVSGTRGMVYYPLPGDHLNVLKGDVAGTADDFTIGQLLILVDGSGKVIGTTGTPESEPFVCLETVTDPTADQLVWVQVTGS